MRRRKKWSPSLAQLETYESLLKEQNKVRGEILRKRAKVEREGTGGRTIPDLVVPKKARIKKLKTYRFKSYREYQAKVKELKRQFGLGYKSFIKENVKKNYMGNMLRVIQGALDNFGVYGVKPEARGGYFSNEQIENADEDVSRVMRLYNRYLALPPEKFAEMYERGFIAYLRYLYRELVQGTSSSSNISFIDEANELLNLYNERLG